MKKIVAMVLALVMVLAIGVTAFAALQVDDYGNATSTSDRAPRFVWFGDGDPVEFYIPAENPDTGAPVMIGSYVVGTVVLAAAAAYVAKHNK